jgi:hypothetical protein
VDHRSRGRHTWTRARRAPIGIVGIIPIVGGLALATAPRTVNAQEFCFRTDCATISPSSHYAAVGEAPAGGALATTAWPRGFAHPDAGGPSYHAATSLPVPNSIPGGWTTLGAPPFNPSPTPVDNLAPVAVGRVSTGTNPLFAVAVNHAREVVRATFGTGVMVQSASGFWSDPAVACTNALCLGVVTDAVGRAAFFLFDGTTLRSQTIDLDPASGMDPASPLPTARPGLTVLDATRFALVRRRFSGGASEVVVHELDVASGSVTVSRPGLVIAGQGGAAGTALAASSAGGGFLAAWVAASAGVTTVRIAGFSSASPIALTTPVHNLVTSVAPIRLIGLARTRGLHAFTWQEGGNVFRMAVALTPGAPGRFDLSFRSPNRGTDRVFSVAIAHAHQLASGPKPLLAWDEMQERMTQPITPRAMGLVLNTCTTIADCALDQGIGWFGACVDGLCASSAAMDAGVVDASAADARTDVVAADRVVGIDGSAMDGGTDASGMDSASGMDGASAMDGASGMDSASATDGATGMDAASVTDSATVMDSTSATDGGTSPPAISFNGGACACRVGARTPRSTPPVAAMLASAAVLASLAARRRRTRR